MIKALSAVTIAAFSAAAMTILPSFAPPMETGNHPPLMKADRLPIRAASAECASQNWPNIDLSCLKTGSRTAIQPARLISEQRS